MASEAGFDLSLRPTEYAALQKESAGGNFQVVMLAGPAASIRTATSTLSSPARAR